MGQQGTAREFRTCHCVCVLFTFPVFRGNNFYNFKVILFLCVYHTKFDFQASRFPRAKEQKMFAGWLVTDNSFSFFFFFFFAKQTLLVAP